MSELLESGVHWSVINFAIFVGLLGFFLRKPVKDFWNSRSHAIKFSLDESEHLKKAAEARHNDLQKRFSRLETDMKDLIQSLQREGDLEKKKLMEDASMMAARIKADSEKIIDQEYRRAREFLKEQAAQLAVEIGEKLVRENLKDQDQKRISDQYLAALEREAV